MKKTFSILGLSLLASSPVWAQNVVEPTSAQAQKNISPQDAQTIFFSEDFIDELTDETLPVFTDENIPLEKNAQENANSKQTLAPAKSEEIPLEENSVKEIKETSEKADIQTQENQTAEMSESPIKNPSVEENLAPAQKKQAEPLETKTVEKTIAPAVAIKESALKQEEKASVNVKEEQSSQPEEKTPVEQNQSSAPIVLPENVVTPQVKQDSESKKEEEKAAEQIQIPTQTEQNDLTQKIRELQQQRMKRQAPSLLQQAPVQAPTPKPQPISKPKSNAFSLDAPTSLPQSILQNDALSVNIMDKGIKISPEQRARMMMRKKYNEMDLNQDGIVSSAEFIKFKTDEAHKISVQVFNQIDENHDGVISEEEYEVLMQKMIENYVTPPKQ